MKAVIDIGSNSILLLVGEKRSSGALEIERDVARVARISEGAAQTGQLSAVGMERALVILVEYKETLDRLGVMELTVVATEGLRMVNNADDFLIPAASILQHPVELLSGAEEARLSYLSVAFEEERDGKSLDTLRVLDIGGGSTELIVGQAGTRAQNNPHACAGQSHPIGSVRLTEMFVKDDPPSPNSLQSMADAIRRTFAEQALAPAPILHGVAGTVTTAAALMLGLKEYDSAKIDGQQFSRVRIEQLRDQLAQSTLEQRLELACLAPGRADVIVAGLMILCVAMEHCGAQVLVVRDRGHRYALLSLAFEPVK